MASKFLNPFHFVPIGNNVDGLPMGEFQSLAEGKLTPKNSHLTHDRYVKTPADKPLYSGRLICTLTSVGPFVIGHDGARNPQTDVEHLTAATDPSKLIRPYESEPGKPAVPASSLRGLISSLVEALSNSAFRVLDNRQYSVRSNQKQETHRRSLIGMIVTSANGSRSIRPLAFGPMDCQSKSQAPPDQIETLQIPEEVQPIASALVLPAYIDGYANRGGTPDTAMARQPSGFVKTLHDAATTDGEYWQKVRTRFWSLSTPMLTGSGDTRKGRTADLKIKPILAQNPAKNRRIVLTCRPVANSVPTMLDDNDSGEDSTRGILRVLGAQSSYRQEHLPPTKKHELFIPVPDLNYYRTGSKTINGQLCNFDLPAESQIREFENLARQATQRTENEVEGQLPFELVGQCRSGGSVRISNDGSVNALRLQDGDLVYFRVRQKDGTCGVDSLAIASLWREDAGHTHGYFRNLNSDCSDLRSDLLPMGPDASARKVITIAEQMFGFISEDKPGSGDAARSRSDAEPSSIRGLASRLRFSDALLSAAAPNLSGYYQNEVRLKILSSPKPPCPILYFRKRDQNDHAAVSKDDLAQPTEKRSKVIPNGRKFYLHHPLDQILDSNSPPWKTQDDAHHRQQKVRATPVRPGLQFAFHIDFDNLTDQELGLLLKAIEPNEVFHHKLGMGKPLGLGTVKLKTVALFHINRAIRYSHDDVFTSLRYGGKLIIDNSKWTQIRSLFSREAVEFQHLPESTLNIAQLTGSFRALPDITAAIQLLGTVPPTSDGYPAIHYPLANSAATGANSELKHFEWFVQNDKGHPRQQLSPLKQGTKTLPTLNDFT